MNIALLTSARAWRGSGMSLVHIARGVAARGHTVHLLAPSPRVAEGFAAYGLTARELTIHDTGLSEARVLLRTLRELDVDVLMAEMLRDLRLGALASLARPFALVYRHNVNRAVIPHDPVIWLAYQRVRLTIFLTHSAEAQAGREARFMLRPPRRLIYEGVDVECFRPDPASGRAFRERHGLGGRPYLLAVGALEWEKRYDWLLTALAGLARPAPLLLVRGNGSLEGAVVEQARRLGVDIRLLGFLTPAELAAAYNGACCMVHAGHVETFGLSVAEAMACGRPVVAVASGTLPEVIGTAGVLASADNPRAFARAVAELLADPDRQAQLGAAARQRAVEQFSLERMGREYADAFEAAAGRAQAAPANRGVG